MDAGGAGWEDGAAVRLRLTLAASLLALAVLPTGRISAQQSQPPLVPGAIAIGAEKGIEWQRSARIVIARGNATARRGDTKVRADVLTAHYRERPDGSIEVWRADAEGDVRLTSPQQSAFGEKASYDVDSGKMALSGGKQLRVTTPSSQITAQERIDYDIAKKTLVARGNAVAVEGNRTLYGDVITIHFAEDAQGRVSAQRIEADGRMRMVTPDETVTADRGSYDIEGQLASATGSVQIIKGANRLNGCQGEMNLRTGVSRLLACPGERDGARVQGVILPNTVKKN
jgi:lipopolysaccharide export system protein LptA